MARKTYHNKLEKKTKKNNTPWDRALRYLSFRPRSEKEVREYLGKECSEEIIDRLKDLKFIDDREYTRMYIEQRLKLKPKSSRLIQLELKKRGITTNIKLDDLKLAEEALDKKLRIWANLPYLEYKSKVVRFLASRGFSWEVIEKTVKNRYNKHHVS